MYTHISTHTSHQNSHPQHHPHTENRRTVHTNALQPLLFLPLISPPVTQLHIPTSLVHSVHCHNLQHMEADSFPSGYEQQHLVQVSEVEVLLPVCLHFRQLLWTRLEIEEKQVLLRERDGEICREVGEVDEKALEAS